MESFATTVLLLTALVLPVLLFLLFRPRSRSHALLAAAVAIAAGWSFNVACILAVGALDAAATAQEKSDNLAIAVSYGWACPLVLVAIAWLLWHLATRRSRAA